MRLFGWRREQIKWVCSCAWGPRPKPWCPRCKCRGYIIERVWTKDMTRHFDV